MMGEAPSKDYLNWKTNKEFLSTLKKTGSVHERIKFSGWVEKISRHGVLRPLVLIITDLALYNFRVGFWSHCKRREDLRFVESLIRSKESNHFVVSCGDSDHHYTSLKVVEICDTLIEVVRAVTGQTIPVHFKLTPNLSSFVSFDRKTKQGPKLLIDELPQQRSGSEIVFSSSKPETNNYTFDTFKFLKVVGKGHFGKVYMVENKASGEILAMKVMERNRRDTKTLQWARSEKNILKIVQHPFIVSFRCAFQTKENFNIVMEFLNGGELLFHLKCAKQFSEDRARFYASEILLAIGHLHSLNIVYRDLKAENVLLDSQGHVKLTDFGLAKMPVSDDEPTFTLCGTPEYISPEVLAGTGHGRAADWWSLGVLIYEMLTGKLPFNDKSKTVLYRMIQHSEPVLDRSIMSKNACDLITKLLQRNSEKRLGSGKGDAEEIKKHSFFRGVDWVGLYERKVKPPFVPVLTGAADDVGNFDTKLTQMSISNNNI